MFKYLINVCLPIFKSGVICLLAVNVILYAVFDDITSTLDAFVWLVLLVMFELETGRKLLPISDTALHHVRNVLIGLIAVIFISYLEHQDWLDVINSLLWFALIALLELEIRYPTLILKYVYCYWVATLGLFAGLIMVVGAWVYTDAWLDAYDAGLWILAFALLEVDLLRFLRPKSQHTLKR